MPLFLSCSNRVEALHAQLVELLCGQPLRDPFQAELIVVPSAAMQRWVNLRLGMARGVAANIDYPLPANWIWRVASVVTANEGEALQDPLSRDSAAWRVFALLPTLLEQEEFTELRRYLQGDETGIKRWQLAQRLADVFDRYQYYRPDWIRAWSAGRTTESMIHAALAPWQGILWRAMIRDCPESHRVALIDRLLSALKNPQEREHVLASLPERFSCFALSSLPPLFVQVLHTLADYRDIYLFQHSPTDQYWADLRSKKALARTRLLHPEEANYYETGNEILASWGRQGQAFQDLLLNGEGLNAVHWEAYENPGQQHLLQRVQSDILNLADHVKSVSPDHSIEISICHSAMRECQVLHDRLLAALDSDPSLKPENILVMIPEISRYAPYIEAVFRYDEESGRPFLPWNLSDITLADEHPLIRVFLRLLSLPSSRFTFSELASYLEVPQIAAHFSLQEHNQEEVLDLLSKSQVRWGLDARHKATMDLPETPQNTWAHGIDRLLAGYALGSTSLWEEVAPLDIPDGSTASALGRFCSFLETLKYWHLELQSPRSLTQWQTSLNAMIDAVFGEIRDDDDKLQQIRDALDSLREQASEQILSIELLRQCMEDTLGTRTQHNRFFSGGVTICGMRPLRSLPFRMICIVGMNDAAFPRREQSLAFDGMAAQWRAGDPRKADEDRYLLLETLLCARERLYCSYTGRSLKDNSEQQPSVLLREFLDFLDQHYVPPSEVGEVPRLMSQWVTTEYPMQAFSSRLFGAGLPADKQSYDKWWCGIAQSLANRNQQASETESISWPQAMLAPLDSEPEQLELYRLVRFLQNPSKMFFNTRLRLFLPEVNENEDEEHFALDGLQNWQMQVDFLTGLLEAEDSSQTQTDFLSLYIARGDLPHGAMAAHTFEQMASDALALLVRLKPHLGIASSPTAVTIPCTLSTQENADRTVLLSGQITRYRPGVGLLHYSPSRLKPKHQLAIWVEHLALCAAGILTQGQVSVLLAKDDERHFEALEPGLAQAILNEYVALYRLGLSRPLPLFPTASFPVALGPDEKALNEAYKCWQEANDHGGGDYKRSTKDSEDPYIALAFRGCNENPLATPEHLTLAHAVYGLLRQQGEAP